MEKKYIKYLLFFIILLTACSDKTSSDSDNNDDNNNKIEHYGAVLTPKEVLDTIPLYKPTSGYSATELASSADLSSDMPPIRDQGSQDSCVGWAVGYYLKSYQEHIESGNTYGIDGDYSGTYSPAFIFNSIKIKKDSCADGSHLAKGLKMLENVGVASWNLMPYNQNICSASPSSEALQLANCAKISEVQTLIPYGGDISDDVIFTIKNFIAKEHNPIPIGLAIYKGFEKGYHAIKHNEHFYQHFKNESVKGFHAVLVVGYDESKKAFKIINSQGKNWGNSGYLWIEYNDFKKIVREAYVTIDAPTPSECPIESANNLPTVDAGENKGIKLNQPITLNATATDSDGNIKSYNWYENNQLISIKQSFDYEPKTLGVHTLTLEVIDNENAKASDTIIITAFANQVPSVDAGENQNVIINQSVTLTANATDNDGNIVSYSWTENNKVLSQQSSFDYTPTTLEEHTLTVTVTDNDNATASDSITISTIAEADTTSPTLKITDNILGDVGVTLIDKEWQSNGVTFNLDFSEEVTGFDNSDITVTNGTKSNFRGSGKNYQIDVTPPTHSTTPITILVASDKATDSSGNGNQASDSNQSVNTVKAFITTWDTTKEGNTSLNQVKITTNPNYTYNYTIDWGDGGIDNNVDGNITHTYQKEGNYTVAITGNFPNIYFGDFFSFNNKYDNEKIIYIEQWGTQPWKSMESSFANCYNVQGKFKDTPRLLYVTSMKWMFGYAKLFNSNINNWNTSKVIDMDYMFFEAESFDQPLDNWDVSNVRTMYIMFSYAKNFNQNINNWDTSHVINIRGIFYGAESFNQPLNNWDTSHVVDMGVVFTHAKSFNKPLNNWDTSNVTIMDWMFYNAESFNQPLDNWDTSNVKDMRLMFILAKSFNQDISSWNVSKVTTMDQMFWNATAFNQDLSSWDVSNVTDMNFMFRNSNLSTENYNKILSNWSQLDLENNVTFGLETIKYGADYADERQYIIDTFNWTINDGGVE